MKPSLPYQIAFSLLPGIGPVSARNLLAYFGSAEKVFTEKAGNLKRVSGIGEHFADIILKFRQTALDMANEEICFIESNEIKTVSFFDKDYPYKLKQCQDAPLMLYYLGEMSKTDNISIGIVGTRQATRRGRELTNTFVSDFSEKGLNPIIISGLAYGIDVSAHIAAMDNNLKTYAVLGHGFDIIYPAAHRNIAERIRETGGALITEFPSVATRDSKNFVKRNRIVAGLSDAVVVVESPRKGGSMVTADVANSYDRDVFAFPGRSEDKISKGCNFLIKTNRAALIESAADVMYQMNWEANSSESKANQALLKFEFDLKGNEKDIFEILKEREYCDVDQLLNLSGQNIADLSFSLLSLELKSVVEALPGKIYALKSR
jgi:DNA processing protein